MLGERRHHGAAHRLGILDLGPGEYRRTRPGDRTAQRAGRHGAALHVLESRNQRMPLRLDDHIVERIADHVQIVRIAAADESGEVGARPNEIRSGDVGFEDGARFARAEIHVRMRENAAQRRGNGNLLHARMIDAHGEGQAAEQAGRDIVDVRGTAGDDFALHRILEQLQARQRSVQQGVRGHHRRHRGRRRSAQTRTERDAFFDVHFEAVVQRRAPRAWPGPHGPPCCAPALRASRPAIPLIERMRTTGSSIRRRRTLSPTASTVCPRISNPMPTLATVAGAKAVTSVSIRDEPQDTRIAAIHPKRRPPPSPRAPLRVPARSTDCRNSGGSRNARHCR